MNTDKTEFAGKHSGITSVVLKAYYDVYTELGSGFLESVYHSALEAALVDAGLKFASHVPLPVYFRGKLISEFKADLVVERLVLVELKSINALDRTPCSGVELSESNAARGGASLEFWSEAGVQAIPVGQ